ncbi:MAG: hypothetical protein ACJLTB_02040 [Algoriphagus aquaeductus]|uniref:hypothetical protein n=1 Tax=Algoriphagus aquaeductus TaxID=475299 RepID=UPI003879E6BD
MNDFENSAFAFEKLLNQLSEEKFKSIVAKIDAKGISGPSVDDYFEKLNDSVSSFFNESETYSFNNNLLIPINFTDSIGSAEKVGVSNYSYYEVVPQLSPTEIIGQLLSFNSTKQGVNSPKSLHELLKTAGESSYTMAA